MNCFGGGGGILTKIGICKFCGQEKELINSHIIPKSFYQLKVWDRFAGINFTSKHLDLKCSQNGLKEPLLCKTCDNLLGELDHHASNVLFQAIPKADFKIFSDVGKTYLLSEKDFNYDKLRRFFISLVWRASACKTSSFSIGVYEDIALKILKNEAPDDTNLFLPIIYRKNSASSVDYAVGLLTTNFRGGKACHFRFPNYEVVIIVDTNVLNDKDSVDVWKRMFTRKELTVIEVARKTNIDDQLIAEMTKVQKANEHLRPAEK